MENIIYILLGIAFFIFKVIQESSKQKKESAKKHPANTPEPYIPHQEEDRRTHTSPKPVDNEPTRRVLETNEREEAAASWEELRQVLLEAEKKIEVAKAPLKTVSVKPKTKSAEPAKREKPSETSPKVVIETNPYGEILSDPDSLKQAFVMSEILKRKEL